ncbi:peptidyl-prolyl cis-trans isomerase G-like [Diorhabda sublineata]|uniref:peptidyl-prolyl cis-trans isomerase G-like n=1 Tax=Diorhabda sublineata TaxID=1163346 RepID=UPI0024E13DC6|nr:peptidyl-prolyl cis-trans isomerase G-like [Diorhabda sublineata]
MNENNENKLDWMYKGVNSHVNEEEYLLGKSVDKTFEQLNNEKKEKKLGIAPPKNHVEHECIPPSIRDFNKIVQEEQVDLSAKLQEDPLAAIKKQEEEARRQFLQNPIQLKKLQEALQAQKKKKKKMKKSHREDDLDKRLFEKLKYLKGSSIPINLLKNEKKENHLDTILMHKFNQLKDKLSQKDMDDILAGKCSSDSDEDNCRSKLKGKSSSSDSEDSQRKKHNGRINKHISEKLNPKKQYHRSKERKNNRDRLSTSEYEEKKIKKERNKTRIHRDSSSSSEYEDRASKKSKNKTRKRRDSSSDSEYKKKKSKIERNKIRKHRDRSSSREYANKKYKKETRKHRDSSSNSDAGSDYDKIKKKQSKRSESSDRNSDRNGCKSYEYKKKRSSTSENDTKEQGIENDHLSQMILEKLRMIRNSNPENAKGEQEEAPTTYSHYDSDNDEYVYKKKSFGLVRSDGTKIPLKAPSEKIKTVQKKIGPSKATEQKKNLNKKLSDKEKEEIRKQMMVDAVKRDKERSDNLRKYKQENEKDENKVEDFDKNFIHRQLSKSQQNLTDVESRIKSKLNNIQRSSQHMNSNFSKRS